MRPLILLLSVAAAHAQHSKPGEFITAPYGPGGTWNLYQVGKTPLTWLAAQKLAAGTTDPLGGSGKPGHLPVISSGAENMFVYHYMLGRTLWIGLTDNEQFAGASEAGSSRTHGWAWVNGEPVTWSNWPAVEPSDWRGNGGDGEDGVAIEPYGIWNDRPLGGAGQLEEKYGYMIEWDVNSKTPVKDARVIATVLPAKWPALSSPAEAEVNRPWVCLEMNSAGGGDIRMEQTVEELAGAWPGLKPFHLPDMNIRINREANSLAFGWIFKENVFEANSAKGLVMLCRARLRVPAAGVYTFNVHCDDGFALRLGGRKWQAVYGQGGIDPRDASVLYNLILGPDTNTRGVVELPAGEVAVELLYLNGDYNAAVQIMTAPGDQPMDGSTHDWRLPGHKAGSPVAWPSVDENGWKLTITPPGKERFDSNKARSPEDVAAAVEGPDVKVTKGLSAINFNDPQSAGTGRFPGPEPYPGDPDGAQDDRALLAEATLVIPYGGEWHIGVCGDDMAAVEINGGEWKRLVLDASGNGGKVVGDSIMGRGGIFWNGQTLAGEITLPKGTYPIRVFSLDGNGPSVFQVFAAPAGMPARLLSKDSGKPEPDHDGLEVLPYSGE